MSLQSNYISHDKYLEINVTGDYVFIDAQKMVPEIFMKCRSLELTNALIDFTKMKGERMATEKALYGLTLENEYKTHLQLGGNELKVAYVGSTVTSYEPAVNIVKASKLNFNLFMNREDAFEWLGIRGT